MQTIIGGHTYAVDAKGNIYKNGTFVPAQNYQYIPASVIGEARAVKSGSGGNTISPAVNQPSQGTVVSNSGSSTTNTPTQQGEVVSGGNGTFGGGGVTIDPNKVGQAIPNAVQSGVTNFGFAGIVLLGGVFILTSIISSFRRAR